MLNQQVTNLVVTPNFDDHLSRALTLFGKPHTLCDHPRIVDRIDPQKSDLQILHVHGTYWFYDCCNLRGEIEGRAEYSLDTSQTMVSVLDNILSNHSPLVIGYSGWDGDVIVQALKRRLLPNRRLPYKLYWFCYAAHDIEPLPDCLTAHPDVCFVVPQREMEEEERSRDLTAGTGRPDAGIKATDGDQPRLPATQVLDALVRELALVAPELTRDPLGFFTKQLRHSLPGDTFEVSGSDPYFFAGLADQVELAKTLVERDKTVAQSSWSKC